MSQFEMTTEEMELVMSMIRNYLVALNTEIDHTDRRDFKRMLQERRDKVASLLERYSTLSPDDTVKPREATEAH